MNCPTCNYSTNKLLVLYVFHEYNERVEHFIEKCIFYDKDVDFILISNNKSNFKHKYYANVKVLFRDNIGYDFGGWSEALLTYNLYENYSHFIFVNSSVMGPFIKSGKWTDMYINGLKDNVKLFGSTINADGSKTIDGSSAQSHVQSYIFAIDKNTLKYLMDCDIFSITNYAATFNDAIFKKEVLMSRKIIENNWNIGSLMNYYKDVDFTSNNSSVELLGDIMWPHCHLKLWNKYEIIFIKGNRFLTEPPNPPNVPNPPSDPNPPNVPSDPNPPSVPKGKKGNKKGNKKGPPNGPNVPKGPNGPPNVPKGPPNGQNVPKGPNVPKSPPKGPNSPPNVPNVPKSPNSSPNVPKGPPNGPNVPPNVQKGYKKYSRLEFIMPLKGML